MRNRFQQKPHSPNKAINRFQPKSHSPKKERNRLQPQSHSQKKARNWLQPKSHAVFSVLIRKNYFTKQGEKRIPAKTPPTKHGEAQISATIPAWMHKLELDYSTHPLHGALPHLFWSFVCGHRRPNLFCRQFKVVFICTWFAHMQLFVYAFVRAYVAQDLVAGISLPVQSQSWICWTYYMFAVI